MRRIAHLALVALLGLLALASSAVAAPSPFHRPASAVREFVGSRTATSRTYELKSGRHLTQITAEPVQWKDGKGAWHLFDLALRKAGGTWLAHSGRAAIALPAVLDGSAGGALRVRSGAGDEVRVQVVGHPSAAKVSGEAAAYANVVPGVDLALRVTPQGLKEDLVLKSAVSYRRIAYRISATAGLTLQTQRDGGLRLVRGSHTVFRIPAPVLSDANGDISRDARFVVHRAGGSAWTVETVVGNRWLSARGRAFPVTVDPTIIVNTFDSSANDDCQVDVTSTTKTWTCNTGTSRQVGPLVVSSVTHDYFATLRFDTLTLVQTDAINSATLKLYRQSSTATTSNVEAHRITTQWSSAALNTSLLTSSFISADIAGTIVPGSAGAVQMDLTELVTAWRLNSYTSGKEGFSNYGIVLKQAGQSFGATPSCTSEPCGQATTISSTQNATTTQRPVLEVLSSPGAPAGSAVLTPKEGELTGRRVELQASSIRSSVTNVRFQYVAGSQRTWTDIPLAALSTTTRDPLTSTDIAVNGPTGDRRSDMVVWDLASMPGGDTDGPVHVRAYLESDTAGDGGMTDPVNFRLDRRGIDGAASADIGPGQLNLLSGEFTMTEDDADIPAFLQDLKITRTYHSRGVAKRDADMFGAGWESNVEPDGGAVPYRGIYNYSEIDDQVVERQVLNPDSWDWESFFETFNYDDLHADVETISETQRWEYRYAVVEDSEGQKFTFTQTVDPQGNETGWVPDDEHPGFTLTRAATGTTGIYQFTLKDPQGNVATFQSETTDSPNYRIQSFQQPGSPQNLTYTYEASANNRQRLKTVTAPNPTNGWTRSLTFVWSNVGSPAVPRVTSVQLTHGNAAPITILQYGYDANARLISVNDVRTSTGAAETYHYDANGRLDQITPPGEAAWNLAYTNVAGDANPRLASISRAHPDGGTATQTVVYNVPLSGSGAPYDMSTAATAQWGQVDDLPWDAVAIFPEDTIPAPTNPDYSKATIHYIGLHGHEVNTAEPGGAISTKEYDANGNPIRELTAANRATALAAGASSATVAQNLSTLYQYAGNGVDLVATREPQTQIKLSDGTTITGRRLTTTNYDENAPAGGPYHLPTSEWTAVEDTSGTQHDVHEKVLYDYTGSYAFGGASGMSGWTARHATKTVVDPNGLALTSYSILHPSYPIVEKTMSPGYAGTGASPRMQLYQYFGITPSAAVDPSIRPARCMAYTTATGTYAATFPSGFLCMKSSNETGTPTRPRSWYRYQTGYAALDQVDRTFDLSGSGNTIYTTHNNDGQLTTEQPGSDTGFSHTYDTNTGRETVTQTTNLTVFPPVTTGTITRQWDSNGRLAQYTDTNGTTTVYHYDLRGRMISATEDGTRTTTYGYDDDDNLTSIADPDVGTMTATYDADGKILTERIPNNLASYTNTWTYDETGRPKSISNSQFTQTISARDSEGRIQTRTVPNVGTYQYTYDGAGRLQYSDLYVSNTCKRTVYVYDQESNRTQRYVTSQSATGAPCPTGWGTPITWTYDQADRATNTGYAFDSLGLNTTSVPALDSGGTGALTATYWGDDYVKQLVLDGRTQAFTRDPEHRDKTVTSSGGTYNGTALPTITSTYHYNDDSDAAAWIAHSDGTTERDIVGPDGMLAATKENGVLTTVLHDLDGNVVKTLPWQGAARFAGYDAFGLLMSSSVIDWTKGLPRYGWLGAHKRATDFGQTTVGKGGPVEMGHRVYLPAVGRFMQVDPITGGSANDYDYVNQDPVNNQDLAGLATAGGACIRGRYNYNPQACKRAGFKITDPNKPSGNRNISSKQRVCAVVSIGISLAPAGRALSIALRLAGVTGAVACL